jgi:hypothetical protein
MSDLPLKAMAIVLELEDSKGKKYQLRFDAGAFSLVIPVDTVVEAEEPLEKPVIQSAVAAVEVINLMDTSTESDKGSSLDGNNTSISAVHEESETSDDEESDDDESEATKDGDQKDEDYKKDDVDDDDDSEDDNFKPATESKKTHVLKPKTGRPNALRRPQAQSYSNNAPATRNSTRLMRSKVYHTSAAKEDDASVEYEEIPASQEFWK